MQKRLGVIDLGSNTFHLLIVALNPDGNIEQVARKRDFVGLGDGGIDKLKPESIARGLHSLQNFMIVLKDFQCEEFRVIGTAALRTASNSQDFILSAQEILGQEITIIDGLLEAKYIFNGIDLITDMSQDISVIMDIGGGSTEFIVVDHGEPVWSKSYKLGVGVLHSEWHHQEPIGEKTHADLVSYLRNELKELTEFVSKQGPCARLIGASGSFEVLESMSGLEISNTQNQTVSISDTKHIIEQVVASDFQTRLEMDGLPPERTKLIVVGLILIEAAILILNPDRIEVCPYALKEGVLAEMIRSSFR